MSKVTVELPDTTPDDRNVYRWVVPLPGYPDDGEVVILRSDRRISAFGVPFQLSNAADARALAAALLAAADQLDAGVTFPS